ncbi:MAG: glycosyltransferase family 39 protein [Anaerolineaceae bacterium]|nr:glycosyltransferase family 39 protein [Anaerolineaceae bacterium]
MQSRFYKQDILVVALLLLGFGLRLYTIGNLPFRGDEAFTVQNWVMQPLLSTLQGIIVDDPHPPLAYASFNFWGALVGTSEVAIRLLPALINTIGIAAMYALGRRLGNRWVGVLAAFLWAIHPFEVFHAQDARNYGIWPGLSATSLWLALKALRRNRRIDWLLYAVAATLSLFIYYLELFVLAALNLYVILIYWRDRPILKRWFGVQVFLGFLFAIWVVYFSIVLATQDMYGGTANVTNLQTLLEYFFSSLAFGQTLPYSWMTLLGYSVLVLMAVLVGYITTKDKKLGLLLGILIIVPVVALSIVSLKLSVYRPRYIMGVIPALILAVSIGSAYLYRKGGIAKVIAMGLVVSWTGISVISLNNYYHDPVYAKSHDWPALADYLARNTADNDLIIQQSTDAAFGYYYHQTGSTALDVASPVSPEQTTEELEATVSQFMTDFDRLWLVSRPIPNWPNRDIIENWALTNMQLSLEASPGGIPVKLFLPWVVDEHEIDGEPLANLDDIVEIADVQVFPPDGNDLITVWVYWRALGTSEAPLKGFVHLTGDFNPATGGPLWSQDDHFPQDGSIATNEWEAGSVYRDVFRLSVENVPVGEYQLILGMYDEATSTRLLTDRGDDSAVIETITLN